MDKICKYDSYDNIPAKVFFEIRQTGNFQLMRGKNGVSDEQLSKYFAIIYDTYFEKSDNADAKRYLELVNTSHAILFKIDSIRSILNFHWQFDPVLWYDPLVIEFRNAQLTALNEYLDEPIDINGDFDTQIQNALNVSLGIMQNDLAEADMELEDIKKGADKSVFEFYDSIANINKINAPYVLSPKVMLGEYVAAEKIAVKQIDREKQRNLKSA